MTEHATVLFELDTPNLEARAAEPRALHQLPHHGGVLPDARLLDDGPQPPPCRHARADPARAGRRNIRHRQLAPRAS